MNPVFKMTCNVFLRTNYLIVLLHCCIIRNIFIIKKIFVFHILSFALINLLSTMFSYLYINKCYSLIVD